jgi:pyruvate/oxaloacetate carboxyltransferase
MSFSHALKIAKDIFKACEKDILGVTDPMEAFQIVQTLPKKLLDANRKKVLEPS